MNLAILRPPIRQLLHADGSDDGESCGFELRTTVVDGHVGCDSHLGDEVEILLVAVVVLAMLGD